MHVGYHSTIHYGKDPSADNTAAGAFSFKALLLQSIHKVTQVRDTCAGSFEEN